MESDLMHELKNTIIVQASTIGIETSFYEELDVKDPREETKNIIEMMEKCISMEIDPWKVDVVNFVKIVRELTKEGLMSIAEAGYIILKSWGIVRTQARDLIDSLTIEDEHYGEQNDIEFSQNNDLMDEEEREFISLKMPLRHREVRKVMLVELIEVMRRTEKIRGKIAATKNIERVLEVEEIYEALNAGEPEKEIESLLNRFNALIEKSFYLEEIWGDTTDERIKVFIYSMFLRKRGYISMEQDVPYGRIRIEKE